MISIHPVRPPYVEFKQVPVPDKRRTEELGYHVTKDVDMAYIMQPGGKDCLEIEAEKWLESLKRKALSRTHDAYPQEWINGFQAKFDAYKQGLEPPLNGTSIKQWPLLSPAQCQNLIALGICTIEDVAAMTEEAMARAGMGFRTIREKAREWLQARSVAGEQIAALSEENETLKQQLASLSERLAQLETAAPPRRGRPPKLAA